MMPYSVLYNLNSSQISHKGDVQMAGMIFKHTNEIKRNNNYNSIERMSFIAFWKTRLSYIFYDRRDNSQYDMHIHKKSRETGHSDKDLK